jgi:ribosomal protein L11 methyltransferase
MQIAVMNYEQWVITAPDKETVEVLLAELSEAGFEGFEEQGTVLKAFCAEGTVDKDLTEETLRNRQASWQTSVVPQQNWNAEWESGFEPVVVPGFCTVRAHFHPQAHDTPYEVIITPKMSFGTGHHETTYLMMESLRDIGADNKDVLDFGSGTGVLAILAEKLGAKSVLAIDNDSWAVENALENAEANRCKKVAIVSGSLEAAGENSYDLILANINRHILLRYLRELKGKLNPEGVLVLSGLLLEDYNVMMEAANAEKLVLVGRFDRGSWMSLRFRNE